jgi:hypothetical protein
MSSIINYVADGSTSTFQIPFNFIDRAHVVVTVDGTTITPTFINDAQLSISPTPTSGLKITVKRETPVGALVDFTDGSTLFEADLDLAHKQNRFIAEESSDRADSAIDTLNANITNINTVATDTVAINTVSGSITNVNTVATNMAEVLLADTNAATATTKASEASVSATASEASKVISVTKAGEASASAASALASKNSAATSETNAAGSAATATTQANLATTNGATQVALATNQVSLATDQANLATTNGAAQVTLATAQTSLATTQASNAAGSAATASTQAGISTTKASEASASATAAAASAASITDEETNAAASAAASAGSATASANSAASAAAALDNFDDRYLGPKSSEPALDNDGDALVSGALYFATTSNAMQVYDGANWIAASAAGVASMNLYEYTATSGQTTFTGADDNGNSISFIAGNEIVVLNGVILDPSDYNSTSGTSIVLASGAATGDLLNVYAFKSFTVADTVSASAGGTFAGNITVTGSFTSQGIDDNANATAITIDSSENVGIGTSSPTAYTGYSTIALNGTNGGILEFKKGDTQMARITNAGDPVLQFATNNAEAMRISSGNVFIGKTSENIGVAGMQFLSSGLTQLTATGQPLYLNRLGSDGKVMDFRKDGTTVGSIQSRAGLVSTLILDPRTGGAGLTSGGNVIIPTDNAGAPSDALCTLGSSGNRYNNLYLSGGVYLGGTGAANKLTDYEFGTWTPTLPNGGGVTVQRAMYTKIGQQVHLQAQVTFGPPNNSTMFIIGGIPFVSHAGASSYGAGSLGYSGTLNTSLWGDPLVQHNNGNYLYFHYLDGGAAVVNSAFANAGHNLIFSITYITNA